MKLDVGRYKMGINKHITDNLQNYLDLADPEYAFLISGGWGVGKTFFINSFIEEHEGNGHKIIKVSLFGLTSVTEINGKIIPSITSYIRL